MDQIRDRFVSFLDPSPARVMNQASSSALPASEERKAPAANGEPQARPDPEAPRREGNRREIRRHLDAPRAVFSGSANLDGLARHNRPEGLDLHGHTGRSQAGCLLACRRTERRRSSRSQLRDNVAPIQLIRPFEEAPLTPKRVSGACQRSVSAELRYSNSEQPLQKLRLQVLSTLVQGLFVGDRSCAPGRLLQGPRAPGHGSQRNYGPHRS